MATGTLKILLTSAEVTPFAKTGGLADVAGSLPKALKHLGHDVRIAMPKYKQITEGEYILDYPVEMDHHWKPELSNRQNSRVKMWKYRYT